MNIPAFKIATMLFLGAWASTASADDEFCIPSSKFKVNGIRLKKYLGHVKDLPLENSSCTAMQCETEGTVMMTFRFGKNKLIDLITLEYDADSI